MKKKIAHYKYSKLAHAPDVLVKCLNNYSDKYEAVLIIPDSRKNHINWLDVPIEYVDIKNKNPKYDLIHFHNKCYDVKIPRMMQYHSPVYLCDIDFDRLRVVVSQYQANLPQYRYLPRVRNIIDFYSPEYKPFFNYEKIRIGFSPSTLIESKTSAEYKGYKDTEDVLKRICKKNKDVEYDVIINVSLEECIERKSKCCIIIDECVTRSFHRSALEGLALSKLTICSMDENVIEIMNKASGSKKIPFENIWLKDLESELQAFIDSGLNNIINKGIKSRLWMEQYWNPKIIIKEFEFLYDNLLK